MKKSRISEIQLVMGKPSCQTSGVKPPIVEAIRKPGIGPQHDEKPLHIGNDQVPMNDDSNPQTQLTVLRHLLCSVFRPRGFQT